MTINFKVGDIVEILETSCSILEVGDVCIIQALHSDFSPGIVSVEKQGSDGLYWTFEYDQIRLVDRIDTLEESFTSPVRGHNIGDSNYAKFKIQPWDIWKEYSLNPWDADIVKRVLRDKKSQSRKMDYEKIIHVCQERIRQIDEKED